MQWGQGMKRTQATDKNVSPPRRPLRLSRETLRTLSADDLSAVAGGRSYGCYRMAE